MSRHTGKDETCRSPNARMSPPLPSETIIKWENRPIWIFYKPRHLGVIDHVEIRSEDGEPLPITETGYRSHFFGPVEPSMTTDEIVQLVTEWLDKESRSKAWKAYVEQSRQQSLF